jgi:hypothetical protein
MYWGTNWGGMSGYERLSHTYNASAGKIVFNFMADNELTVFNTKTRQSQKANAGSKYFTDLKSLSFHPLLTELYRNESTELYQNNFAYLNIVYDRFRNMYYRITDFPSKHPNHNAGGMAMKQNSVILLDSSFNRVGEVVLPFAKYNVDNFFVTEKGLHLKRSDIHNDELLWYDCLSIALDKSNTALAQAR